ncbi:phytanoyl-CoA dioxygenase family protein [Ruegeria arenilitoris]|uniref:phytanoyl-CoA dioxygenase family protein n=1 Tax=Ruegeria arenilitoris TaxID=1173585 RepID=UPI0020C263CF|nr:phytanoyl-CoA dioxygenase family protein [Ruegeria arenilitoris]
MYKRVNAHVVMPSVARIALDPRVLDVVQGVLGPDILLWSAELFIKEPRTTQVVGMHQDLTYWGMGETPDQLTAWIALSPATVESGCMDFVKGSHRNPILPHNDTFSDNNLLSRGQEVAVDVAEEDKTHIELRPGQMSLHHGLTIHGSGPNVSNDRRIGLAIRYLNPNAQQKIADRDYAMLARGRDKVGNFIQIPAPTELFSADALNLHAQIRLDQAKAMAQGASKNLQLYGSEASAKA